MALNPSIILAGQPFDLAGSMSAGNQLAAQTNQLRDQNALRQVYQTQGAGILSGDQNALNALAAIDPITAINAQGGVLQNRTTQRQFEILNAQEKRAIAEAARTMSEAQRAEAAAAAKQEVLRFIAAPTPEIFDQMVTQAGKPELAGQWANRQMLGAEYVSSVEEALKLSQGPERPAPLTDAGKAAFDAQNGWIQPGQAPVADPKAVMDLRKEYTSLPTVKNFATQSDAYAKVVSAAADPSAAGDLALIFSFMKMLDPTSVVREQEFANAQNAAGVPERVRAMYNNVLNGQRLTPTTRADFLAQTDAIYKGAEREYANVERQFSSIAERQGLPTQDVIVDFRYSGPRYEPPVAMRDLTRAGIGTGAQPQAMPAPTPVPQDRPAPAGAPNRADVAPRGAAEAIPETFKANPAAVTAATNAGVTIEELWENLSPETRARLSQ